MTGPAPAAAEAGTKAERLYAEHAGVLLRYVSRLTGDVHRAEDIVQETLLRAWLRAGTLRDDPVAVRSWLFRVAHNVAIDELRYRRARPVDVVPEIPDCGQVADPSDGLVNRITMNQALTALPPEHRSVLVEIFYGGRSTAEAAQRLHIPHGTAKSRLFYGLRKLRDDLVLAAA
jgi:RNA polymerase sigma-70 factor (ECF subfamily)